MSHNLSRCQNLKAWRIRTRCFILLYCNQATPNCKTGELVNFFTLERQSHVTKQLTQSILFLFHCFMRKNFVIKLEKNELLAPLAVRRSWLSRYWRTAVSSNSNGRVEKKATQMVLTSRYIHVINEKYSVQFPLHFVGAWDQHYLNNKFDWNLLSNLGN